MGIVGEEGSMRVHYLQHVPFEGPGCIADWVTAGGHTLTSTHFYRGDSPPEIRDLDWLVVMGGPMNIYEHERHPWLIEEKAFLRRVIDAGKTVIGVCLGAQLIADVLGAAVTRGAHKEIGWLPIDLTPEARRSSVLGFLPGSFPVFHWHGDTFGIPEGAVHLAESAACKNQAFLYSGRVLALQFHLESTPESVAQILAHCADDITPSRYVQTPEQMQSAGSEQYRELKTILFGILDRLPMPANAPVEGPLDGR